MSINQGSIHRKEKDGDWYIYYNALHPKTLKEHITTQSKIVSHSNSTSNFAVGVKTIAVKPYISICLVGLVWFARYCGKVYSRHLFPYGGLRVSCKGNG